MMFVLDASAIVAYLTTDHELPVSHVFDARNDLHIPAVCDVEVVSALVKQERRGRLDDDDAQVALIDYVSLPLTRHLHTRFITRSYELRNNVSAADASYVALAESLEADLVTLDRPLAGAVSRHTAVRCLPLRRDGSE